MNKVIKNIRNKILIKHTLSSGLTMEKNMIVRLGNWRNSNQSMILLFSIHSVIYDGLKGYFKISAFLSAIRKNVNQKVSILMCEAAHLNVLSLKYNQDLNKTLMVCQKDAQALYERFKQDFIGFEILYWKSFINENENCDLFKKEIMHFFKNNFSFQQIVKDDVEKGYTERRAKEYPNKSLYNIRAELDVLEMILGIKIAYERGYRMLCYPGSLSGSIKFLQPYMFPEITFINISIKQGN